MRSLAVVTKHTWSTSPGASNESEVTVSHYLGSLIPQSAARSARLVRGHWGGCEIRNHWVRDVLFKEDGNLAVMRCAVIALKTRHASHLS